MVTLSGIEKHEDDLDAVLRITQLDIGSPKRYFQSHIPQLALREPLVLSACLSCASHLLCLRGDVDKDVEEHYRSRVLSLLIPVLSSEKATSANEGLLATTVVLRMSEQFLEPTDDCQHHLKGAASLFFDGTHWPLVESSLGVACFWTHLRESIRICFLTQQPCSFNTDLLLDIWSKDSLSSQASEEAWSNRMTLLMLEVCTLCWDSSIAEKTSKAGCLMHHLRIWKECLPASFRPWAVCEIETEPFAAIRCLSPWHGKLLDSEHRCCPH